MKNLTVGRGFEIRRIWAGALLVLLSFGAPPARGQEKEHLALVGPTGDVRLAQSILVDGHAPDYLRELSDRFGGRVSGSEAYDNAAAWALNQFRQMGIHRVYIETFPIPCGWQRGTARGYIRSPLSRPLHIESLGWSPPTPTGGIQGTVLVIEDLDPAKIAANTSKIKSRVVLLSAEPGFGESWTHFEKVQQIVYRQLHDAGAAAILLPDVDPNQLLNADAATWDGSIALLPVAQIGLEDAKLIERLADKSQVEVALDFQNRLLGPLQGKNVIAELPSDDEPNQWIMLGAHLDSWDYATGTQDNGSGAATILEVARVFRSLSRVPHRSLRFVLWGGEEQGMLGSTAWVRSHRQELPTVVAYLNTDNGGGHPLGWKLEGRKDLQDAMDHISKSLSQFSGDGLSLETTFDSDHAPFVLTGVPTFDLWIDETAYFRIHHKSGDTFDKINPLNLNAGAAIVALTAYALAEHPEPIGKHLDLPSVTTIIQQANIDLDFLRFLGWNF
jgi:carboxypeptidase Q